MDNIFNKPSFSASEFKYNLACAFAISLVTLLFTNFVLQFSVSITGQAMPSWGILGRWVHMIFTGQFYTSAIAALPPAPLENIKGYSVHILIGVIFSLLYVYIIAQSLPWKKQLLCGFCFGLILIVCPLFIELPSMGSGFLGLNTPHPLTTLGRVASVHSSFGLGLAVGSLLLRYINRKKI